MPAKECLSNRIDELASESEGKQAKPKKIPSSVSFYVGCYQKVWPTFKVGLLTSNDQLRKSLTGVPAAGVLVDSRCGQVDSQDWLS